MKGLWKWLLAILLGCGIGIILWLRKIMKEDQMNEFIQEEN